MLLVEWRKRYLNCIAGMYEDTIGCLATEIVIVALAKKCDDKHITGNVVTVIPLCS